MTAVELSDASFPLPSEQREFLYVENTYGGDVSVVEVKSGTVIDRIDIGGHPDDVISAHAGDVLYLSVGKSHQEGVNAQPVFDPGEIVAVDAGRHEILWRLPVSGVPHHLTISRDDRLLFVPIFNWNYLEVIDTQRRASIARVPVGYGSHGTQLSPDGRRLYVGTMFHDQLAVVDVANFQVLKLIPFPEAVRPFGMTSDEKRLFAQLSKLHGFVVVDLERDEIIRQIDLPTPPPDVELPPRWWPHSVNHGLYVTPDDRYLLAAGSIGNYIAVYALPQLELITTIPVGKDPNWIIPSKREPLCFVSNRGDDTISFISLSELAETNRVSVGRYPQRMTTVVKSIG